MNQGITTTKKSSALKVVVSAGVSVTIPGPVVRGQINIVDLLNLNILDSKKAIPTSLRVFDINYTGAHAVKNKGHPKDVGSDADTAVAVQVGVE